MFLINKYLDLKSEHKTPKENEDKDKERIDHQWAVKKLWRANIREAAGPPKTMHNFKVMIITDIMSMLKPQFRVINNTSSSTTT